MCFENRRLLLVACVALALTTPAPAGSQRKPADEKSDAKITYVEDLVYGRVQALGRGTPARPHGGRGSMFASAPRR